MIITKKKWKRLSIAMVIKKMQVKTTMRYHYTCIPKSFKIKLDDTQNKAKRQNRRNKTALES